MTPIAYLDGLIDPDALGSKPFVESFHFVAMLALLFLHGLTASSAYSPPSFGLVLDTARLLQDDFLRVDLHTQRNLDRVLSLYRDFKIDATAFHGVNGYGHGDYGRECLDGIVARLMGAEAALVRLQLFSGTHAISTALFGKSINVSLSFQPS